MLQALLMKKVVDIVIKRIVKKHKLNKLRKYVEEENELDKQISVLQKKVDKYARIQEYIEKDIAILKVDAHPPVFMKDDYRAIIKRLDNLEKK